MAIGAQQQTAPTRDNVPTKTYVDEAAKVSFRYPLAWTLSDKYVSYFPAAIAPQSEPVQVVATFGPQGNLYAKTNLAGLDFVYRRVPGTALKDCVAIVTGRDGGASEKQPQVSINGVVFTHVSTSDAGMSKSVNEQVYVTERQGTCFLFEEDLHTVAPGVVDGTHELTAQQTSALKRHLDDVMQTVTFGR